MACTLKPCVPGIVRQRLLIAARRGRSSVFRLQKNARVEKVHIRTTACECKIEQARSQPGGVLWSEGACASKREEHEQERKKKREREIEWKSER